LCATTNPFAFTGRDNDSTGTLALYNYRSRSYSPSLQRFLTEDPIGFAGADLNLYSYAGNEPVDRVDSMGLAAAPVPPQFGAAPPVESRKESSNGGICGGVSCWSVLWEAVRHPGASFEEGNKILPWYEVLMVELACAVGGLAGSDVGGSIGSVVPFVGTTGGEIAGGVAGCVAAAKFIPPIPPGESVPFR